MYLYNIHVLCSLIISYSVFTVCLQTTTAEPGESSSSQKFVSIINAENSFIQHLQKLSSHIMSDSSWPHYCVYYLIHYSLHYSGHSVVLLFLYHSGHLFTSPALLCQYIAVVIWHKTL